jgi:hypothetical protein
VDDRADPGADRAPKRDAGEPPKGELKKNVGRIVP